MKYAMYLGQNRALYSLPCRQMAWKALCQLCLHNLVCEDLFRLLPPLKFICEMGSWFLLSRAIVRITQGNGWVSGILRVMETSSPLWGTELSEPSPELCRLASCPLVLCTLQECGLCPQGDGGY